MKGQYFSFDAIIGGVIFILTAMALFSYWYGVTGAFDQQHELLAREAFRVSEMLFAPLEPGVAVDWKDAHLNLSEVKKRCGGNENPKDAFGSGYMLSLSFNQVSESGGISKICAWGEENMQSGSLYRLRRTASFMDEGRDTTLGYVDIFVYEPPRTR